jgi:hypothetical protein
MKLLVETTSSISLIDSNTGAHIRHNRPCVVPPSQFLTSRAMAGQVRVLKDSLPDAASDVEFAQFWKECEGDQALAVDSFLSSLQPPESDPGDEQPPESDPGDEQPPGKAAKPGKTGRKDR